MAGLGATYSGNYMALPWAWKLSVALVDGAPALVHWRSSGTQWLPHSAIRLWWEDGQVVRIRDYVHLGDVLRDARIESDSLGTTR